MPTGRSSRRDGHARGRSHRRLEGREEPIAFSHDTGDAVNCLQLRGEYLYVAQGRKGFEVYDAASIGNKGVSQRLISAPFSPLGHDTQVGTTNATCVALPTTQPIAPERNTETMQTVNQEQPFHPIYDYALVTDSEDEHALFVLMPLRV